MSRPSTWVAPALTAIAVVSLVAVAGAVAFQHVFDKQPCPWCILQRVIFLIMAATALLGSGWARFGGRVGHGIAAALAGVTALLGATGVTTALYQNQVASRSPSCDLTLADRIISGLGLDRWQPELFEVRASCAEAQVDLLGVPMELWSLTLYVLLIAAALWCARQAIRR